MSRTSRIAGSFAIVMIAYWAYALLAVPWIEPSADQRRVEKISQAERERMNRLPDEQLKRLRALFPPGGMEALGLIDPIVIESNRAKLLFQTYENQRDGSIVLTPFVIVFAYEGPAEDEAQRNRQSVILEAPGARLQFDPPLDINRAKIGRLVKGELAGSVTIRSDCKQPGPDDDLRIQTKDVQLAEQTVFTPHPVDFRWGPHFGRGQEMVMKLLAGKPRPGKDMTGTNIAGIESFEMRRIERLHLDLGQAGGKQPIGKAASVPVEIQCRGPFRFDVLRRTATFSERVDVLKLNPGGPADQIACDVLSMYFTERKPGKDAGGAGGKTAPDSLDLIAERLECRGRPVVLTAPSRKLVARAPQIEYNLLTEALAAEGAGQLSGRLDQSSDGQFEAAWQKSFQYYPHQGKRVISLDGGAELNYQNLGRLRAREIFFWLAETPPAAGGARANMRPDRMLARDDVRLDSPQLSCKLSQMEIWFEQDRMNEGRGTGAAALHKRNKSSSPRELLETARRRFEVSGRLLQANVLLGGPKPVLSRLVVQDGVCIRETSTSPTGDKPVRISGDRLEVADAAESSATALVTGGPACFEAQGLKLTGANINLDRGTNRMWIDGAGRMEAPLPGKSPNQPADVVISVDWRRRMVFEGGTARFEESVVASGPAQQLRTELMEVQLSRKISFSDPNPPDQPQVEIIRCPKEVLLENRSYDKQQQLSSYDRLQVTDMAVNAQSGALTAGGPGWLNSVRRGDAGLPGMPNARTVSFPDAETPPSNDQLYCLTVRFQGSITGNLRQRQLTFNDQVRAARGPVGDWNSMLPTDNPDALGPDGVTLRCGRLSVVQMPIPTGNGFSFELEASGDNTVVEGTTYSARGRRITYAEAKDLLVLEGDGRTDAELSRQQKPGMPPMRVSARKFRFWPKTEAYEIIDARSLQAGGLPPPPGKK